MNPYAYNRITGVIRPQLEKGKLSAYFNSNQPPDDSRCVISLNVTQITHTHARDK